MGRIQYAVVARGAVVLAEHGAAATNAGAVARQILERLPDGAAECHVSYTQDLYVFHVKRTDGVTALCMTDDAAGRRIPFAFLEDIHGRFVKTYGRAALTALAYAMNDEFSRVLSQQMDYYSNDPNADRINRMRGEMDQVRSVMIDNIDKVLERGDRLELLVDKTATMQGNTMRFKRQARRFRNTIWWRNVKLAETDGVCSGGASGPPGRALARALRDNPVGGQRRDDNDRQHPAAEHAHRLRLGEQQAVTPFASTYFR